MGRCAGGGLKPGHGVARAVAGLWVSRALGIVLNLLLLPLLFRHIASAELGVWLLMGQAGSIVALMDFGLTSVLTRRIAIADGTRGGSAGGIEADQAVADLLAAARPLYRMAAGAALAGALLAGWAFSSRLGLGGTASGQAASGQAGMAWACLSAAYACALLSSQWTGAVTGLGHVAAASLQGAGITVVATVLQGVLLLLGGGIGGLAALVLAGALAQRWAMLRLVRSVAPGVLARRGMAQHAVLRDLLAASLRYWLTELGAVGLLRTDQFFIAGLQQTALIPAYYAAYSMVYNLALVAMAVAEATSVFVSRLWRDQDPAAVHALVLRSTRIGLALMLCGSAALAVVGDSVIQAWVGPGRFVGRPVLLTFCAMLTLFVQQSLLLGFSRATENEAYAPCYLLAGALNLLLTWLLAGLLGLLGIALGTLLAQAATTSWFVPASALRRLRIGWRAYLGGALLPALGLAALTLGATLLAVRGVSADAPLRRAAAGLLPGGAVAAVGCWCLILDAPMRRAVRRGAASLVPGLR